MVSLSQVQANLASAQFYCVEYQVQSPLNLYNSAACDSLATQAATGRHLRIMSPPLETAIAVRLCEDDYPGWLAMPDLEQLELAASPYQAIALSTAEITAKLPAVIAFTQAAMEQPNHYLWGGTVGPNYDCSGLMQTAFAAEGIWIPRDAYQQEAFIQAIAIKDLHPGDLVFFGPPEKATHVGLYLGNGRYIHSSGKDQGRNGIGIDQLSPQGDLVSQTYYRQLRGAGRVIASYQPYSLSQENPPQ